MGNETTGIIMPIYSDMLLNSEDPKVLILPASVDKAIIVTTKNNKRLDEVLEELERSGGTIKSIELNGDTVAIGENGTVNLGNLLSGESLKTINNEGLVGNTNINLINAVFGKYGTEGNVTTFLVPRINDNTEAFVPATASEHTLYIDVYNNKIYRYVDNEYVVALDTYIYTSGFALKTELNEKANASDVVPNNRTVNNKPLSSDVTIGMGDIPGLEEAIGHIEAGTTVVINSDGANVVDSHSNPSILVAPSARQMMMAANNIDILFRKVNDLYDKLAGIAFTEDKPANWKENANWLTPAVPTHTITLGTMTNVSASLNGMVINGSTSAEEGEVTILLTPSGNNYMSGISIKDASNHDVDFTQTDVAGGTEITFILYGNVTINASASSGIQVNVSGNGITSYTTGVMPNTASELTIALPAHHTWGTVAITYGTDDITSQCTFSQANDVDKVITLPATLDDMSKVISIVANAVEDDYATLNLENVGEDVVVNHDTIEHLYVGDTITIQPSSGNKVTASATIGGNAATLTGNTYDGYSYTIGSDDVSSVGTTIAITAIATGLDSFEITLPQTGGGITSVALTDLLGNPIEQSNNAYLVDEYSGVKIVMTPSYGYELTIDSITSGQSTLVEDTDYTVTTDGGVVTITIEHVTGGIDDISVSAASDNPPFRYVGGSNTTENVPRFRFGSANAPNSFLSPLIPIDRTKGLVASIRTETTSNWIILYYNSNFVELDYHGWTYTGRSLSATGTGSIPANTVYIRVLANGTAEQLYHYVDTDNISSDVTITNGSDNVVFRGSDYVEFDSQNNEYLFKNSVIEVKDIEEFVKYEKSGSYDSINDIYMYCSYGNNAINMNANKVSEGSNYYPKHSLSYFITRWIPIPVGATSLRFRTHNKGSNATSYKTLGIKLRKTNDGVYSYTSYDSQVLDTASVRSINLSSLNYEHVQLFSRIDMLEHCFIQVTYIEDGESKTKYLFGEESNDTANTTE